jgi:hypothetical protein
MRMAQSAWEVPVIMSARRSSQMVASWQMRLTLDEIAMTGGIDDSDH